MANPKPAAQLFPQPRLRRSILGRTLRHSLALTALAIVISTVISFLVSRALIEQRVLAQVSTLAAAKEDFLEGLLQADRERASLLAAGSDIARLMQSASSNALETMLQKLRTRGGNIEGAALFGRDGVLIAKAGVAIEPWGRPLFATMLVPQVGDRGWEGHVAYAPVRGGGILALHYSARGALQNLIDASSLGRTGEVFLGMERAGDLVLLQYGNRDAIRGLLPLGPLAEQLTFEEPVAQAVTSQEGVRRTEDYLGRRVFIAYRSLPSFGWGLAVEVQEEEALGGVVRLASLLLLVGAVLLLLSGVLAVLLARRLTGPLRNLATRIGKLSPGHWGFRRGQNTGDEVELLDRVVEDLTRRLRHAYEHLEDEVADRTRELHEQYAVDRTILESIQHGIVLVDQAGTVTAANPAAETIIGKTAIALIGMDGVNALSVHQHQKPLLGNDHPIMSCLKNRMIYRPEPETRLSISREDGTLVPVALMVTPLRRGRKALGAVVVFQDVTEERQVDYLKSEFISLASHQLRTPLSAMMWYTELLTTEDPKNLTPSQHSYVAEMQFAAQRMVNLVETLLQASRLEGGAIQSKPHIVDLNAFVMDASEDMRLLAKERKIGCIVKIPSRPSTVLTDPMLLSIVMQNVFSNAVKYSPEHADIRMTVKPTKEWVEIIIEDSGVGIPAREMGRLFQKLFRAENVRKMDTDGSGLGLYISRLIMDNLNGEIHVQSKENKGTTVTVRLPRKLPRTSNTTK